MTIKTILAIIALVAVSIMSFSQEEKTETGAEDNLSFGLTLNTDPLFGFNPMMTASYELSEKGSITGYGIQWGAGSGSAWGTWTEIGAGYNFVAGNFDINPQLGFTMGNLLSSGVGNEGVVGDGIVPNLTVNYGSDKLEGQFYFGYYGALRNNTSAGNTTLNYVHYWGNVGHKVSSVFSFGAHFEQLFRSSGKGNAVDDLGKQDYYTWVGPYVQLQKKNAGLRFSGGWNLVDDKAISQDDFYKLSFFLSL